MSSRRSELIRRISVDTGISKPLISDVLDDLARIAEHDIMNRGTFTIPKIVTINVFARPSMRFRNVRTGRYEMTKPGYKVNATVAHYIKQDIKNISKND